MDGTTADAEEGGEEVGATPDLDLQKMQARADKVVSEMHVVDLWDQKLLIGC